MTFRRYTAAVALMLVSSRTGSTLLLPLPSQSSRNIQSNVRLFASGASTNTKKQRNDEYDKQVVRLTDPRTNRDVILVGCMHYNPASIKLAKTTALEALATSTSSKPITKQLTGCVGGGLAAVLVESCRTRWDAAAKFRTETLTEVWQRNIYDVLLPNEMRAAADVATANGVPVVLADQDIETTGERVKTVFKDTLKDVVTPWEGGWQRIGRDVKAGWGVVTNSLGMTKTESDKAALVGRRLTYRDFFDAELLLSMPVSLARYPLGILLRFPKFGLALASIVTGFDYASTQLISMSSPDSLTQQTLLTSFVGSAGAAITDDASPLSWSLTFLIAALETIFFTRVFMIPILAERDVVLAKSVVAACAATGGRNTSSREAVDLYEGILEDKSANGGKKKRIQNNEGAVVAVLGAAHVNGVRDIILNGVDDDPLLRI